MKRGKKFLEILNSKPVIGVLIFVMLGLAGVFAGDMIFDSGDLNVSSIFYVDESSGKVGIGTSTPSEKLEVEGNLSVTGTIKGSIESYDTGWINRSDWTNVHLGSSTTKNADSDVAHNLNVSLSDMIVKVLISTDGTDANSFEIAGISRVQVTANVYGFMFEEIDSNNIKIQTGTNGMMFMTDAGTHIYLDVEDWYYKIKVWKLG